MKTVVIVRLDHLGDVLLTTPLARAFHREGWAVDMVVQDAWRPLFDNNPHVAAVHAIEEIAPGFPATWPRLARWLRRGSYELMLLPNANQRQQLLASLLSGVGRRYAMWSGVWGRLTLHHCVRSSIRERARPFADVLLDLARAAGVPPDGLQLDLAVTDQEVAGARAWVQEHGVDGSAPLVGVHPGCAGNTCNLPSEMYAQIAGEILDRSQAVVVATGTADERALLATWPERVRRSARFISAVGELSLRQLAAVISLFAAYVVPSTGPLHMASALKVATVSPFCGWSTLSPVIWGNHNGRGQVVGPALSACDAWRAANPGATNCDFRGDVKRDQIVERVLGLLLSA
jgi:ADP-heptose:LPS heptosyltransferase